MRKINRLWGVLILVVFVTGCPDGPPQILRDERNCAAEVADYLSKVVDEESGANAKAVMERLKDRWESIKKRRESYVKLADKAEKKEFSILQKQPDYDGEMKATMARLKGEGFRVRLISPAFLDQKVAKDIDQFASKVFGGEGLKIPDDPSPPEQKGFKF